METEKTLILKPYGFTEMYGDICYDQVKMYYTITGNYDQFNLKGFRLYIGENSDDGVNLKIESGHWEDMADTLLKMAGTDEYEIKLLQVAFGSSLLFTLGRTMTCSV